MTVAVYAITYMDRVVMSAAVPSIQKELGLSMVAMGWILASFRWGVSLFQIPGGWLGDRLGPRRALTMIVTAWSVFTTLTPLCWNAGSMLVCRFLFGTSEAGSFPIATRSLSRWLLPAERGMAQGLTHAGSRLGAAVTPPIVVALILAYGWRAPFFGFGLMGILWAAAWYYWYRNTPQEHAGLNQAERDLIRHSTTGRTAKADGASVPWRRLLGSRNLWLVSAMYFCYSSCIAFYLDWYPTYLQNHRGFSLRQMGFYAMLPLLAGTVGDVLGGWFSDRVLERTGRIEFARRSVAIGGFLLAMAGIIPATLTRDPVACVLFSCIGVFGLEITVGISWALPLDMAPEFAGSASAVMNMCGNIGGALSLTTLAYLVKAFGWNVPFFIAAGLCLTAALLHLRIDAGERILDESEA
jgi:sugar phosphate permease